MTRKYEGKSSWRDSDRRREYLRTHPEQRDKARQRAREAVDRKRRNDPVLRRKIEIYEYLVGLQGGEFCAICKATTNDNGRRFAIDHDWETDEIRGLLCRRCNNAIGNTRKQGSEWLTSALGYLERPVYTGIKYEEVRRVNRVEYANLNGPRSENEGRAA